MRNIKFCQKCGLIISRINDADWYSHMSIKYCADCAKKIEKEKSAARVAEFRKRKRMKEKYRDEQLELLKEQTQLLGEENELLRKHIVSLREELMQ